MTISESILKAIDNLTDEVRKLKLSVSVNARSTCCGAGGDDPPSDPGSEVGDPPLGPLGPDTWDPPLDPDTQEPVGIQDQAYFDRKCKAANMIWDGLYELCSYFETINLEDILKFGVSLASGVILEAIAFAITSGPLLYLLSVAGIVVSISLLLFSSVLDFGELAAILSDNKQDIICALYTSQSAGEARSSVISILNGAGATAAQQDVIWIMLIVDVLNTLMFKRNDDIGIKIEEDIVSYGASDCSSCAPEIWIVSNDPNTPDHILEVGVPQTAYGQYSEAGYYYLHVFPASGCRYFTIKLHSFTSPSQPDEVSNGRRIDCQGTYDNERTVSSLVGQTFQCTGLFTVDDTSGLSFQVELISIP